LQNSPLESSCVVVALIENYSTSKPLNVSPEKSEILSCDTVVANERYVLGFGILITPDILACTKPKNNSEYYNATCRRTANLNQ
jgi:hypothetical protein